MNRTAFRLLSRVVDVRPDEVAAALLACLYFFFLLSSYFILRPIRDAMGVAAGVSKLPWLFAGTLGAMLVANPVFSLLVARLPARRFIPVTYQFFALNLVAFYFLERAASQGTQVWAGRVFFVWTSVFNLFVPSVFWSLMADHFSSEQAKRLFGFIGVGGTVGSILGTATTAALARTVGPNNLLLVSAVLLEGATLIVLVFPRGHAPTAEPRPVGGGVWEGLLQVLRTRYLLGISGFLLLYTLGSTVLYFEQADVVGRAFSTPGSRTAFLAQVELAAQVLALLTQALLTGRIMRWLGLAWTLALMPALSVVGFALVGLSARHVVPVLGAVVVFSVLRRGTNFALTNPSMEVLFTVVGRPTKFKAKSFIETFVYRAGDQIAAWSYGGLTAVGLGLTAIAWLAVPASAVFLALGLWLGRKQATLERGHALVGAVTDRQSEQVR